MKFRGGSESAIHMPVLYHIRHELEDLCDNRCDIKIKFALIGSVIHHPDRIFEGDLNIQLEIGNLACGISYGHIYILATATL